ncbi:hypothetical protein JCM8097_007727 [Rhodosporidiobolus ruineniae]
MPAKFTIKNKQAIEFNVGARVEVLDCSCEGTTWDLSFREMGLLVNAGFHLGEHGRVVMLKFKDKNGKLVDVTDDEGLKQLKAGTTYRPRKVEAIVEHEENTVIDIKVGVDPVYQVLQFDKLSPPSFADFLSAADQLHLQLGDRTASEMKEVYIRDLDEEFVKVTEETWMSIGWKRAVKVFEEAAALDNWYAAAFHIGPMCLSRRRSTTMSGSGTPRKRAAGVHGLSPWLNQHLSQAFHSPGMEARTPVFPAALHTN